jgi:hypothetical protein
MRTLLICLALFATFNANATTEEEVIKTFPRPALRLPAFDGTLLGFDRGEWGGQLVFLDQKGQSTVIHTGNVNGMAKAGDHVLLFSGLEHLTSNSGSIFELVRGESGVPTLRPLLTLEGDPYKIQHADGGTVRFRVSAGRDKQGQWVQRCKSIDADLRLTDIDCL